MRKQPPADPQYARLKDAYGPFTVQHLNPFYLFFFPLAPGERVAMSNDVVSLDADGFRGKGPRHADGRRLAFLLGGSSAFGHLASADSTTITGYMNRMQNEFFFVNAGVPSWNSTQELYRLAMQILDFRPALVIAYDGANDAGLAVEYAGNHDVHGPAGSPESFGRLSALVDDIRGEATRRPLAVRLESVFRELAPRVRVRLEWLNRPATEADADASEADMVAAAHQYVKNLTRMQSLAEAEGARFIAVFQPVWDLHRHRPPDGENVALSIFHRTAFSQDLRTLDFHDMGRLFDAYYQQVPKRDGKMTDSTIFIDDVHLSDLGNRIVADNLLRAIDTAHD